MMSAKETQARKAELYKELKAAGVEMPKKYAQFTIAELEAGVRLLHQKQHELAAAAEGDAHPVNGEQQPVPEAPAPSRTAQAAPVQPPLAQANPDEMAGERLNRPDYGQPIRVDEANRTWYQEEVKKPSYPKPRGRRVIDYIETGTEQVEIRDNGEGKFTESFEVAGKGPGRPAQVKITLPSYQVGIYTRPGLPFRVFTYNGNEGFDFFEVNNYYGGVELVPPSCKRKYVENVLCYEIASVINTIRAEYRHLQMTGRIK